MELNVFAADPIELLVVQVHREGNRNHHLFGPAVEENPAQIVHRVKVVQERLVVDKERRFEDQKVAVVRDGVSDIVQMFPRDSGVASVLF